MWFRHIPWIDPIEAASRLAGLPGLCVLDSAMAHPSLGRYSTVAADPFARFAVRGGVALWNDVPCDEPPVAALRARLADYAIEPVAGLPPFQGGAIGAFAYEFGWTIEGRMPPTRPLCDDVDLAFHDIVVAFDHEAHRCWLIASGHPAADRAAHARARLDAVATLLARPAAAPRPDPVIQWRPTMSRDAYRAGIERVKAYIRAGDIYQANIAQRFVATTPAGSDPWSLYRRLREANPAPFAAYLDLGARQVLSTSPELFLRTAGRHVETRPIKGTARRRPGEAEDREARAALLASQKDRAENVMIVDLLRNDLSRVCTPVSVEVEALCALESYAGLHHLVSSVVGTLRDDADALDLLAASFPGGSITGAPKLRAMEIIAEIEGVSRGMYCGAIGAIGFDGAIALNIAIRTVVVEGGALELRAGGGITMLSDADTEYEETLTKARRIFDAFAPAPVDGRIWADAS
jgi:para-aminobenzoate synthetase component 1